MNELSRTAGGIDAYEFYIEDMLDWQCTACSMHLAAISDIRKGEEEAPYGPWTTRHAKNAKHLGWYVPPLTKDGSLLVFCLCPSCAKKQGFVVTDEPEA